MINSYKISRRYPSANIYRERVREEIHVLYFVPGCVADSFETSHDDTEHWSAQSLTLIFQFSFHVRQRRSLIFWHLNYYNALIRIIKSVDFKHHSMIQDNIRDCSVLHSPVSEMWIEKEVKACCSAIISNLSISSVSIIAMRKFFILPSVSCQGSRSISCHILIFDPKREEYLRRVCLRRYSFRLRLPIAKVDSGPTMPISLR